MAAPLGQAVLPVPLYKIARFAIRPDAGDAAERAMHDLASHVRGALPDTSLTIYRVGAEYIALLRGGDSDPIVAALSPHVAGNIDFQDCSLVTSSDLQRRHRR